MSLLSEVGHLVKKDTLIEYRQKYAFGGILLYVVTTVFIIYMVLSGQNALAGLEIKIWNILFWITLLFAAVNAIAKSFFQESRERQLYYYILSSPHAFIIAKMVYNFIIMLILTALCVGVYTVMIGNPVKSTGIFAIAVLLGGSSFSFLFSMISSIASKANNNSTLMAILGFPIILPMLVIILRLSRHAFIQGLGLNDVWPDVGVLLALNVILVILAFVLFPYLWRD